jgi:hypothetical protein
VQQIHCVNDKSRISRIFPRCIREFLHGFDCVAVDRILPWLHLWGCPVRVYPLNCNLPVLPCRCNKFTQKTRFRVVSVYQDGEFTCIAWVGKNKIIIPIYATLCFLAGLLCKKLHRWACIVRHIYECINSIFILINQYPSCDVGRRGMGLEGW